MNYSSIKRNQKSKQSIIVFQKLGNYILKIMLKTEIIRVDSAGDGHFGARRIGHKHQGVDLLVTEHENVFAPENGVLERVAYPYSGDFNYTGFLFIGDSGKEYKVFYCKPLMMRIGKRFDKGEVLAHAQAISKKYKRSAMLDHIHVQVYENGKIINPENLFNIKKKVQSGT